MAANRSRYLSFGGIGAGGVGDLAVAQLEAIWAGLESCGECDGSLVTFHGVVGSIRRIVRAGEITMTDRASEISGLEVFSAERCS